MRKSDSRQETEGSVDSALQSYKKRKDRGRPKTGATLVHPEIRAIYVPDELQMVWAKFQKIMKREGRTVSEAIVEYVCDYTRKHEAGNPQQRLDTIRDLGKAYRADSCQISGCNTEPKWESYDGKRWLRFCSVHFDKKGAQAFREIKKN